MPEVLKYVVSAGVGAGDIALEEVDARTGRTEPFKKYSDWYRVGLFLLGLFGDLAGIPEDVTEPIALSTIPLVEKTVWSAVKKMFPVGYSSEYELVPEETPSPSPSPRNTPGVEARVFSV